jgi:hypothetical protein
MDRHVKNPSLRRVMTVDNVSNSGLLFGPMVECLPRAKCLGVSNGNQ